MPTSLIFLTPKTKVGFGSSIYFFTIFVAQCNRPILNSYSPERLKRPVKIIKIMQYINIDIKCFNKFIRIV